MSSGQIISLCCGINVYFHESPSTTVFTIYLLIYILRTDTLYTYRDIHIHMCVWDTYSVYPVSWPIAPIKNHTTSFIHSRIKCYPKLPIYIYMPCLILFQVYFQLWGESVSLVILFLCLGLAKMVFCSEGEPPVGVLHSDTEPSRASSVLRCFSKYDLGLTLPSVGQFVRKWITWIKGPSEGS